VWKITHQAGLNPEEIYPILYNSIACVLTGAVFGDHCSPISDTTILSSLSTSCNHLSHVRTQMPYAITVGAVSLFLGIIPAAFGASLGLLFLLGVVVLFLIIRIVGKSVPG
jgi:Na+/H+ antiporter NhaC